MKKAAATWTIAAQAKRIAVRDAGTLGIDLFYGLLYVLLGFFLSALQSDPDARPCVWPFVALVWVMCYMTFRLCGPEGEGPTATFYANLPRGRMLSYWTHAAGLGVYALAMEILIGIGVALRIGAANAGQVFEVSPYAVVLPFLAIAFMMWLSYLNYSPYVGIPVIVGAVAGLVVLVGWDVVLRRHEAAGERTGIGTYGLALALWLAACLLAAYGAWRWKRRQLGEM